MVCYHVSGLLLSVSWGVGHAGGVTPYAAKMLFSTPVVSMAYLPQESNSKYCETTVSSKLVDNGLCVVLRRLVRRILMCSVPGARGSQTYVAVLGFLSSSKMARRPGGIRSGFMPHIVL